MKKRLTLLHTSSAVIKLFENAIAEIIPQVNVTNVVDENILSNLLRVGRLTPQIIRRICDYVIFAEESGVDGILLTCSSISPCADIARHLVSIPVMKIDDAMIDEAVRIGNKIGIIATLLTTIEPTKTLIQQKADIRHKKVNVETIFCSGAFKSLMENDIKRHDEMILNEIIRLSKKVDVIILAQASMSRLADEFCGRFSIPILTSIKSGIKQVRKIMRL